MMGPDPGEIEVKMQRYYKSLSEKDNRIWAAIEALKVLTIIGQPLLLELLFLTDCRTSGTMWATSRLAPPTILVTWPVTRFTTGGTPMARYIIMEQTRFCSDVMGALATALLITSSNRTYRP
jgi:hypothetical protein